MHSGPRAKDNYALICVHDLSCRPTYAVGVNGSNVRFINYTEAAESSLRSELVLVDVGVVDPNAAAQLASALRAMSNRIVVAFDVGDRKSVAQARAIGATSLLSKPVNHRAIKRILNRFDLSPPQTDAEKACRSLVSLYDILFSSLTKEKYLEPGPIHGILSNVSDCVETDGLNAWLTTVRQHHSGTYQHCMIVTGIAIALAKELRFSETDRQTVAMAALMHDIGKIKIPTAVLDKPAKLSSEELSCIRMHPRFGYDYLNNNSDMPDVVLDAVLHHHEFLDGTGYPDGLVGHQIGDVTRLLTICDIFGALVERRSYKPPMPPQMAFDILLGMSEKGKVEAALVNGFQPLVQASEASLGGQP